MNTEKENELVGSKIWLERPAGAPETLSGIPIKESYGPEDIKDLDYNKDIGAPGRYPFTRGLHSNMYRGKIWGRRVWLGHGTCEHVNEEARWALQHGWGAIGAGPDLCTNLNLDSDHPLAIGYSGVQGCVCDTLRDVDEMFDTIDLSSMPVVFHHVDMCALPIFAAYLVMAQGRGYDISKLRGSLINDPISNSFAWCSTGIPNTPLSLQMKIAMDIVEYCIENVPLWHTPVICAYDISQQAVNAIQELGLAISEAKEYIRAALRRGIELEKFTDRMMIAFSTGMDFFESIAKYRAARRMWARMMCEEFGIENPKACRLFTTTHTDGSSLTVQQPANNIVRVTLETLAAVLGGAQNIDPCTYDEAICIPSRGSALIASNTSQIIAYETGVVNTSDPLGGSYYIEYLTNEMEKRAREYHETVEGMGGIIAAIESGWAEAETRKAKIESQKEVEEGKRRIVGVNELVVPKEEELPMPIETENWLQDTSPEEWLEPLKKFKAERNIESLKVALRDLSEVAKRGDNLMPATMQAMKADATQAEVLGIIREANGLPYDPFQMIQNPFW